MSRQKKYSGNGFSNDSLSGVKFSISVSETFHRHVLFIAEASDQKPCSAIAEQHTKYYNYSNQVSIKLVGTSIIAEMNEE
ncbi:MAG: hypothetical protein ACP5D1_06990 [Bacteroidales bacterium]